MPRYNDPPTCHEMEEGPLVGEDCDCCIDGEAIRLCPMHDAANRMLAVLKDISAFLDNPFEAPVINWVDLRHEAKMLIAEAQPRQKQP